MSDYKVRPYGTDIRSSLTLTDKEIVWEKGLISTQRKSVALENAEIERTSLLGAIGSIRVLEFGAERFSMDNILNPSAFEAEFRSRKSALSAQNAPAASKVHREFSDTVIIMPTLHEQFRQPLIQLINSDDVTFPKPKIETGTELKKGDTIAVFEPRHGKLSREYQGALSIKSPVDGVLLDWQDVFQPASQNLYSYAILPYKDEILPKNYKNSFNNLSRLTDDKIWNTWVQGGLTKDALINEISRVSNKELAVMPASSFEYHISRLDR